jgi:hypothetical protein
VLLMRFNVLTRVMLSVLALCVPAAVASRAQGIAPVSPTVFRVGEKLTYDLSFEKLRYAGYAELSVVSYGKLSGRDAVELRLRMKTVDVVNAAFFNVDQTRTTYAAPDTGTPLFTTVTLHDRVLPKEITSNFLTVPTSNFDLVTLIYKAREQGGVGTFTIMDGGQLHTVTMQRTRTLRTETEAGTFETAVSTVQSNFLTSRGISDLTVGFTTDAARLPVIVRFRTSRGRMTLTLRTIIGPEESAGAPLVLSPVPVATPIATPLATPFATPMPRPTAVPAPTPTPYIDNRPLNPELGFELGEALTYQVSAGKRALGTIVLSAKERKQFQGSDSLLLTATVTSVEPGADLLRLGDAARAQVDPETLAPTWQETRFASNLNGLKQTLTIDRRSGMINFGGAQPLDAPVGTHTVLSLAYAMRSFNLQPSRDSSNPVNDTRAAVFWDDRAWVFILRPSAPDVITVNGEKVPAQLVTIATQNPQLDALGLKVWLGVNDRVPLRFAWGPYQADLISRTVVRPT